MNKMMAVLCVLFLCSCEKDIDFDLKESSNVLVVDAQIENGKPPTVILTRSLSFFSQIEPAILLNSFVHDAEVYMSNGALTHRLKEYAFPLVAGYQGYFYGIDSTDLATAFQGEFNKRYTLKIRSEGKDYNAETLIPALNSFPDSFYFKRAPLNPDSNKRVLFIRAADPQGLGNYVRYFTKKNDEPFLPGENSVYNDQVIDGTTYDVQFPGGIDRNNPPKPDSNFFKRGDSVTLKFCNISLPTFTFWSSWEFAYQSIGNPFAQPNKVVGNISNDALGAFCGYAAWYGTKVVE